MSADIDRGKGKGSSPGVIIMRTSPPASIYVNWDLTYACPLRCEHCYSESGRRPSRQLGLAEQLRIAEQIIKMRPQSVQFSSREPLIVPGVFELAKHLVSRGVRVHLYTICRSNFSQLARFCEHLIPRFPGSGSSISVRSSRPASPVARIMPGENYSPSLKWRR